MEQLIACRIVDGNWGVRPIDWGGIWDKNGSLDKSCNNLAEFAYEQDAKDFVSYRSIGPVEEFRALKEAEEKRREGCEYCQAGAEIQHYFEIREEYGGHELYGYDKFGDECSANIYFCPICGRNLRGGSHDGDSGSRPSL